MLQLSTSKAPSPFSSLAAFRPYGPRAVTITVLRLPMLTFSLLSRSAAWSLRRIVDWNCFREKERSRVNRKLYIAIAVQDHADNRITLCMMIRESLPVMTLYHFPKVIRFEKYSVQTLTILHLGAHKLVYHSPRVSLLSYLYLSVKANEAR